MLQELRWRGSRCRTSVSNATLILLCFGVRGEGDGLGERMLSSASDGRACSLSWE